MATGRDETDQSVTDFMRFNTETYQWTNITNDQSYPPIIGSSICIYDEYFYIISGWDNANGDDVPYSYRAKLDGVYKWEEVTVTPSVKRDSSGNVLVQSKLYIFGGFTKETLKNDLLILEMDKNPIQNSGFDNYEAPAARVNHSMQVIASKLLVFGGGANGVLMNDLWCFDIETEVWTNIISSGEIPSPRQLHGSSSYGDALVIWGGISGLIYLNDVYIYHYTSNSWEQLDSVNSIVPSARHSPCVAMNSPFIYMYGGLSETGYRDDLWVYNISDKTYTLENSDSADGPGKIKNSVCTLEESDGDTLFYVMYGTATGEDAKGEIHVYNFTSKSWTLVHKSSKPRNAGLVRKINNKVLVGGGENWGAYLFKDFFYIDLGNCANHKCSEYTLSDLNEYFLNGGYAYINNHVYLHMGSSPQPNVLRAETPKNAFMRIKIDDFECSIGSELKDGKCEVCEKGHFKEDYGESCIACSPGHYNNNKGANNHGQCVACEEGKFNPYSGSSFCLDCPVHSVCPVSTRQYYYEPTQQYEYSSQPKIYEIRTDEAMRISFYAAISTLLIGFSILLAILFWTRLRNRLHMGDIFRDRHTHTTGQIITLAQNKFGGLFSFFFLITSIILIAWTLPSYLIDNLIETKSQVPLIILTEDYDFMNEMIVTVTLKNYFAPCNKFSSSECDDSISYTASYITNEGEESLSCIKDESSCEIKLRYEKCGFDVMSELDFYMTDMLSYASVIIVNITTFSSIPNEYSTTVVAVNSNEGEVLKGSTPSAFYFTVISSLYKNSISHETFTGFHTILSKSAVAGTSTEPIFLPYTSGLSLHVELSRSENGLLTLHDQKQPIGLLLFTLLGSIVGAFEVLGAVMAKIEDCYTKERRITLRMKENILEKGKILRNFLHKDSLNDSNLNSRYSKNNTKVLKNTSEFIKSPADEDEIGDLFE